jgi:hypothetical protein
MGLHSRDALRPSFANSSDPQGRDAGDPKRDAGDPKRDAGDPNKGAGKTGCALHPRSRVQGREKGAHEHTGSAEAVRPSLRNGFTVSFALSLVTGLLSPSPARILPLGLERQLRGVRTTRLRRPHHALFVKSAFASTASHPDVRDDGQRPLVRDETARNRPVICPRREAEYFCARGWTRFADLPGGQREAHTS